MQPMVPLSVCYLFHVSAAKWACSVLNKHRELKRGTIIPLELSSYNSQLCCCQSSQCVSMKVGETLGPLPEFQASVSRPKFMMVPASTLGPFLQTGLSWAKTAECCPLVAAGAGQMYICGVLALFLFLQVQDSG